MMKIESWKDHMDHTNCHGAEILERGWIIDVLGNVGKISANDINEVEGNRNISVKNNKNKNVLLKTKFYQVNLKI